MIRGGLEYGYICTGQAFVFLHVPEDFNLCENNVAVPNRMVGETTGWSSRSMEVNRLHLTSVAQVLCFSLMALEKRPRPQEWIAKAASPLKQWAVDLDELLKDITLSERKNSSSPDVDYESSEPTESPAIFRSTPRKLRSRTCDPFRGPSRPINDNDSDGDEDRFSDPVGGSPTPLPSKQRKNDRTQQSSRKFASSASGSQSRQYCTQRCLRGLQTGGVLDQDCPNFAMHRGKDGRHAIDQHKFLHLMQKQLGKDLDTDSKNLYAQGSRGALFKVTLTSHGYTVAGKGTIRAFRSYLRHEASVYRRLQPI